MFFFIINNKKPKSSFEIKKIEPPVGIEPTSNDYKSFIIAFILRRR